MAQEVLSSLIFQIGSNSAELTRGLQEAKGKISAFSKGVSEIGNLIKGAFAATAIIGATKQIFQFSQEIGHARDKVRSLGLEGKELVDATAKARAISETFNLDFEKLLESARAVSKEFGISVPQALDKIRDGYAQSGSEEFIEILREYPAQFVSVGASADEAFAIISQSITEGIYSDKGVDAIKEAGLKLREMTPATKDALAAIGISSEALQASIANGSMTTFQAIQQVSQKLSGFKDDSRQVGQVLADVFGGAGEDAGIRFIKMIGQANLSFDEMTEGVNDTVKAQLHLAKANEDLNKIWVSMFGGSATWWTELKADLIDIAVNSFKAVKRATIDVINYFIDLYNESVAFRLVVEQVVFWFKELWTVVKLVGRNVIDIFSSAGKLISAVFKGEFDKIPGIYADAIKNVVDNAVTFGQETAENFKEGIEGILRKDPIKLITTDEVQSQVASAVNAAKQTVSSSNSGEQFQFLAGGIPDQPSTKFTEADLATSDMGTKVDLIVGKTQKLKSAWDGVGESMNSVLAVGGVNAINAFGAAMTGMVNEQEGAFKGMIASILSGIQQVLNALLAEAILGLLKHEVTTKGIVGLGIAVAGISAVMAIFNSLPAFEKGGNYKGGLALVGERGPELINFNSGGRVFNNSDTMRMLNNSGSKLGNMRLEAVVTGEQLRFILKETERRRS